MNWLHAHCTIPQLSAPHSCRSACFSEVTTPLAYAVLLWATWWREANLQRDLQATTHLRCFVTSPLVEPRPANLAACRLLLPATRLTVIILPLNGRWVSNPLFHLISQRRFSEMLFEHIERCVYFLLLSEGTAALRFSAPTCLSFGALAWKLGHGEFTA